VGQAVRNTVGRPVYVRVDPPEARALHVLSRSLVASVGGATGGGSGVRGSRLAGSSRADAHPGDASEGAADGGTGTGDASR
jgi:hypothetical protein